jgi:hypothetical protein
MGLSNTPISRKCGTEEEISVHVLCACKALASLRHSCLGPFFDLEDIRKYLEEYMVLNMKMGNGKVERIEN